MPFHNYCRILRVNLSTKADRKIEQEIGIMPYAVVIYVHKSGKTLNLVVFAGMIEPAGAYGHVNFGRKPFSSL